MNSFVLITPLQKNKKYKSAISNNIIGNFTIWFFNTSIMLFLVENSSSASIGVMAFISINAPIALFSIAAGIISDKYNKDKIILISNLSIAFSILSMQLFQSIQLILIITFFTSSFASVRVIAMQSNISSIIDVSQLNTSSSINSISLAIVRILGTLTSGYLYSIFGFFDSLLTLTIPMVITVLISIRSVNFRVEGVKKKENKIGVDNKRLMNAEYKKCLFYSVTLFLSGSALWSLIPYISSYELGLNKSYQSAMMSIMILGAIPAFLIRDKILSIEIDDFKYKLITIVLSSTIITTNFFISYSTIISSLFIAIFGFLWSIMVTIINREIQSIGRKNNNIGLTISITYTLMYLAMTIGSFFFGQMTDIWGLKYSLSISALVMIIPILNERIRLIWKNL
ncbi:MFS transporter [Vibrio lentus]|nr:MFS transporter [Vibrio lentus]MCC4782890.1 MFS transporter [Vibrio lentus]MCC4857008.1 MFS transporter [Vibrio lentus]TKF48236.1 MFS transporter [Vibrio lentus]TKF96181.1 MFS transporter [Vibrio lentus]TKG17876.1 MFS transporter [Vibrio lentus]